MSEQFEVGQRICAKSRGMDATVHWHGQVVRITKTTILVRADGAKGGERRFRREGLNSIPYSPYGGSAISTKCQRPKKESK